MGGETKTLLYYVFCSFATAGNAASDETRIISGMLRAYRMKPLNSLQLGLNQATNNCLQLCTYYCSIRSTVGRILKGYISDPTVFVGVYRFFAS